MTYIILEHDARTFKTTISLFYISYNVDSEEHCNPLLLIRENVSPLRVHS